MKTLLHILALMLLATAASAKAGERPVLIDDERVHLRDVMTNAPIAIGDVDLGASPVPGERRVLSEASIRASLKRAAVDPQGLRLPKSVVLVRRGQQIDVPTLEELARREVVARLPEGLSLKRLEVHRGITLPEGNVAARIVSRSTLRSGFQSVTVELRAGDSAPRNVIVSLELAGQDRSAERIIHRGDRVLLVVERPGLRVQMYAIAQQDGAMGDSVPVLPVDGVKVVRAKVRDASTVEVLL